MMRIEGRRGATDQNGVRDESLQGGGRLEDVVHRRIGVFEIHGHGNSLYLVSDLIRGSAESGRLAGSPSCPDDADLVGRGSGRSARTAADLRPGPGRSGAARLALTHPGVPVIPIGMWGPRPGRRHLWHRHTVRLVVGEPVDLTA